MVPLQNSKDTVFDNADNASFYQEPTSYEQDRAMQAISESCYAKLGKPISAKGYRKIITNWKLWQ